MYALFYTKAAQKDAQKLAAAGLNLKKKCQDLLDILAVNPYQNPPPYEKLIGDLAGCFSRRINIQHRLIYIILEQDKKIKVLRMWSHYE